MRERGGCSVGREERIERTLECNRAVKKKRKGLPEGSVQATKVKRNKGATECLAAIKGQLSTS